MKKEILSLFNSELPGEKAHKDFSPLRGSSSEAIKAAKNIRESAVAIVLFEWNNELNVLLTKRQEYKGTHSGQISFPGGKVEESDPNYLFTALREAHEEVGIDKQELEFVRLITPVYIPVSNFRIHPHVFWWNSPKILENKNTREVAEIGFIALNELFQAENIQYLNLNIDNLILKDVAHFIHKDWKIWGATGVILNEIKQLILF